MKYKEGTLIREENTAGGSDTLLLLVSGVEKTPKQAMSEYRYERIFYKEDRSEPVWYRPEKTISMSSLHSWAADNEVVTIEEVRPEMREMAEKQGWV